MSSDTKWIIGTGISLVGVLAGLMLAQFSSMNSRLDDLGHRIDDLQSVVRGMDERLRAVEIGLAEVKVLIADDARNPPGARRAALTIRAVHGTVSYPNIRLTMNTAAKMPAVSASRHAGTVWRVLRMPTAP